MTEQVNFQKKKNLGQESVTWKFSGGQFRDCPQCGSPEAQVLGTAYCSGPRGNTVTSGVNSPVGRRSELVSCLPEAEDVLLLAFSYVSGVLESYRRA